MLTTNDLQRLTESDAKVVSTDGEKIGSIGQAYVDENTGEPTWLTVKTGLFGTKETFVPVDAATVSGDEVRVPYDKDTIKNAPTVDPDGHVSREEEDELYRYYNLQTPTGWDDDVDVATGATAGVDTTTSYDATATGGTYDATTATGTATAGLGTTGTYDETTTVGSGADRDSDAIVRSEERVDVGTRRREAGRVRLRKYVVTENVTKTVPVQREEVRIEREPVTGADAVGATIGEGDDVAEVTLHEDEVVVDKRVEPVEKVRLGTDTVTDERQVTEEVRKERIETEGDGGTYTDRDRL